MIPDGGGGSRRFPRLFAAGDIVLGCWTRVRSFSDRFRVFFMDKSTPPSPPSRAPTRCSKGKSTENAANPPKPQITIFASGAAESSESSAVGFARLLLDSSDCVMCLRHFSKRAGEILALRVVLRKHSRPIPLPPNHAPVKFLTSSKQYSVHNGWKFSKK